MDVAGGGGHGGKLRRRQRQANFRLVGSARRHPDTEEGSE